MSEPSVSKFASVVVMELLSGSRSTLPHVPVDGIDQVRRVPGGDLQSERVAGDRFPVDEARGGERRGHGGEFVDRDLVGGVPPSTASRARPSLAPLPAAALGVPPLATT